MLGSFSSAHWAVLVRVFGKERGALDIADSGDYPIRHRQYASILLLHTLSHRHLRSSHGSKRSSSEWVPEIRHRSSISVVHRSDVS